MKRSLRRAVSLLCVLAMCLSLLPTTALASGEGQGGGTGQTNLTPAPVNNNDVEISKTAKRTGEDTWKVTMTVTAKEQPIESEPLELVLLLDRSGSMAWCTEDAHQHDDNCYQWVGGMFGDYVLICKETHVHTGGEACSVVKADSTQSRQYIAGEAAKDLINQLAKMGVSASVSVVGFSDEDYNTHGVLQTMTPLTESSADTIKNSIPTTGAFGGTYMNDGLKMADWQFSRGATNKVIVLLADGDYNGIDPNGDRGYVSTLAQKGVVVHTIGFTTRNNTLQNIARRTNGNYYTADNATDLANVFTQIADSLTAMVEDDMGEDVEIVDSPTTTNGTVTVSGDGKLTWNPKDGKLAQSESVTITYTVKLTDAAKADLQAGSNTVSLNGDAVLTYKVGEGQTQTLDFPLPTDTVAVGQLTTKVMLDGTTEHSSQTGNKVIIYGDTTFSWEEPQATITVDGTEYTYSGSTYDGTATTANSTAATAGSHTLVHNYTCGPVITPTAKPITIQVVVDGDTANPVGGASVNTYITVNPYQNQSDSGAEGWNSGTYSDGTVTYSITYYDCKDIGFAANSGYVIEAIDADLVYGQSGCDGIYSTATENKNQDLGTYVADNVQGGSTVTVYVRTVYTVEYYQVVDGGTPQELTGDAYTDNNQYVAETTTFDDEVLAKPNTDDGQTDGVADSGYYHVGCDCTTDCPHIGYTNETGAQEASDAQLVVTLDDDITLPELPTAETDHTVSGWWLNDSTCDGETTYDANSEVQVSVAVPTDADVIKFYALQKENDKPGLEVTKTLDKVNDEEYLGGMVEVGDTLTYTITVKNTGNTTLYDVKVTDTINGAGTVYLYADADDKTENVSITDDATATITELKRNDEVKLTATYQVVEADAGNKINNEVVAEADDGTKDDGKTPSVTVEDPAWTVNKIVDDPTPDVGDTITYTITVTNTGNTTLNGLTVTDTMGGGRTVSWKPLPSVVTDNGDGTLTINGLEPETSVKIEATYTVVADDAGDTFTNTVTVSDDTTEEEPENPPAVTVGKPGIEITKTVTGMSGPVVDGEQTAMVGDELTYTIMVTNTGETTFYDVTVSDNMWGEGKVETIQIDGMEYPANVSSGSWKIAAWNAAKTSFAPGETWTCTYTYTVPEGEYEISNTAVVNADGTEEKDTTTTDVQAPSVPIGGVTVVYFVEHYLEQEDGRYIPWETERKTETLTKPGVTAYVTATPKVYADYVWNPDAPETVQYGEVKVPEELADIVYLRLYYDLMSLPEDSDIVVKKWSDDKNVRVGDTVEWTITVENTSKDFVYKNMSLLDMLKGGEELPVEDGRYILYVGDSEAAPGGEDVPESPDGKDGDDADLEGNASDENDTADDNDETDPADEPEDSSGDQTAATEPGDPNDDQTTATEPEDPSDVTDPQENSGSEGNNGSEENSGSEGNNGSEENNDSPETSEDSVNETVIVGNTSLGLTNPPVDFLVPEENAEDQPVNPYDFTLDPGEKVEFTVSYTVKLGDEWLTNVVEVLNIDGNVIGQYTAEPINVIQPVVDLEVTKTCTSGKTASVGDTITWDIKITNIGDKDAYGVTVEDNLPGVVLSDAVVNVPASATVTVEASYVVRESDRGTTLYNTVVVSSPDDPDGDKDTDEGTDIDDGELTGTVAIRPADITIYTGGQGYTGIIGDGEGDGEDFVGSGSGLPEPGYYIELPKEVNDALLEALGLPEGTVLDLSEYVEFTYDDGRGTTRTWELERYDSDGVSQAYNRYVYRLLPAVVDGEEIPVRLAITGETVEDTVLSDVFDVNLNQDLYREYNMDIYSGDLDQGLVQLTIKDGVGGWLAGTSYGVEPTTGTLTIRGVTGDEETAVVGKHTDSGFRADVPNGTTYTINESDIGVNDHSNVQLLVDEIVTEGSVSDANAVVDALVENSLDALDVEDIYLDEDNVSFDMRYMDLVDGNNGNVYVTASKDVTILWPVPNDADLRGDFHVVHFDGLDREFDGEDAVIEINGCQKVEVLATDVVFRDGQWYVEFTTDSFSPFVLVYEEEDNDRPSRPRPDPDDDKDDEDEEPEEDLSGLNTTDHYAYIAGYEDGTVRPDGNITRAEVATIFFRLMTDEYRETCWSTSSGFTDVTAANWYNNAISTTANAGWVSGYPDGTFRPDAYITRAEFATIAARFLSDVYSGTSMFTDISGHWAEDYINRAAAAGWINGYADGTFRPNAYITRAEAVTLINRMLDRAPDANHLLADMVRWPDNPETAWYYADIQEATNSHDYTRAGTGNYEVWTELLANRDWAALEEIWSQANDAPGGEVADGLTPNGN